MTSPRLVVCMGVYNEAQYLDETIPAVLAQTMPDFGLLILNNGSTDDSTTILRDYRDRDQRIVLVEVPRNLAPARATNAGMGLALTLWSDAPWFLPHGADDIMLPDYVETVLDTAALYPNVNLIFSPWQWIDHPEKGIKRFPTFDAERCHAVHMIPAWSAVRRELWTESGGHSEAVPIASDWDWVVRSRAMIRAVQLTEPKISLRVRPPSRLLQSEEVHWPTLHRHLCGLAGKPVPAWARG